MHSSVASSWQRYVVCVHCCVDITTIYLQNPFHLAELTLCTHETLTPLLPPTSPQQPSLPFLSLWIWSSEDPVWVESFSICPSVTGLFIALTLLSSGFIHVVVCVIIPFLLMAESYSIVCINCNLFFFFTSDGHLSCFYLLAIVNNASMIRSVSVRDCANINYPVLVLCALYPVVELMDCAVFLCWIFWGTLTLVSTVAIPFYIPISNS